MSNNNYFTSTGFDSMLDLTNWGVLQKYLLIAASISKSPDRQTDAILQKIIASAQACSTTVLPVAHSMGNTLFNYANTMVATLGGLEQLMAQDNIPKDAVEQLVSNLISTAKSALGEPQTVNQGLINFESTSSSAGNALTSRLTTMKAKVSSANETISSTSSDIDVQLKETSLNVSAIDTDIENLENVVLKIKGVSFVGLNFSVTQGVTSGTQLATAVKSGIVAWNLLLKELNLLDVKIKQSSEADLKAIPSLTPSVLKDAKQRWQALDKLAHNFMLNFFVSPQ